MREMKDSGIEWIGDVPKEWDILKLKNIANIQSGEAISKEEYEDFGLFPIIGANGIVGYVSKYNNKRKCLTTGRVGTIGTIQQIDKGWVTDNALIIYENENLMFQDFLKYIVPNFDFLEITSGTAMPLITATKLYNQFITCPPLQEQQRIADFLDEKCSEIDSLTKDIQEQIATLEEYKKSIITEAVTKGLEPNVEMKDSGIEWIGEVPKEWEIHPVYFYFGERKEKNSALKENNLLSLSYGNIVEKDINTNGGLLPANFTTYNIVRQGDIIIRPTDLQNDKRSLRTGLVKERGIITSAYIDLVPNDNVNSRYFHYLLHSYDVSKVFYNMGNGVRQGLNYSEFSKLKVLYPPVKEQQFIANFLDNKCNEIDTIIATKKEQLETLAEYKKSLIYEYVTGKKEVPVNE